MRIRELQIDDWEGPRCRETRASHPTWDKIEGAIRQLDANRHTCVSLVGENGHQFLIGGGAGQFVLVANPDDETHLAALDLSKSKEEIELTVGGQTGIYTAQMVLDEGTALKATMVFCESNTLDSRLNWSKS